MAACRSRIGPYDGAVELKAVPEPELPEHAGTNVPAGDPLVPAPAHPRWLKSLANYDRRYSSEVHGGRYG
jgi:hypothetical protein